MFFKESKRKSCFLGKSCGFFPPSPLSFVPDVCHFSLSHFLFLIFVFFPSYIPSPSVYTHSRCIIVVVVVCVDVNMSESNDGQCIRLSDCTRGGNKMFELVRSSITEISLVFSLTKHLFLVLFLSVSVSLLQLSPLLVFMARIFFFYCGQWFTRL